MSGHYEVLQISRDASVEDIRKAYRTRSQAWHFDHNPKEETNRSEIDQINEAYRVLSDEALRAEYDKALPGEAERSAPPKASKPKAVEAAASRASEPKSKAPLLIGGAVLLAVIGGALALSSGPKEEPLIGAGAPMSQPRAQSPAEAPAAEEASPQSGVDPAVALLAAQSAEEARKKKERLDEEQKAKELKEKEAKEKELKEKELKEKEAKEQKLKAQEIAKPAAAIASPTPPPAAALPAPKPVSAPAPAAAPIAAPSAAPSAAASEPASSEPKTLSAAAACPSQAVPAMPKLGPNSSMSEATVRVRVSMSGGEIKNIKFTSGPKEYQSSVRAALGKYKCANIPGEVVFLQEFHFKPETE